jgi:hypothetical protein
MDPSAMALTLSGHSLYGIGVDQRFGPPPFATRMPTTFAAERTLGRLGKWLRLMGFDTLLESEYPKGAFIRSIGPDRIFLTRTRRLAGSHGSLKTIFIRANDPEEQLAELIRCTVIRPEDIQAFTRCMACNEPIVAVDRQAVHGLAPDYIWHTQANFSTCPKCGRVYWRGTHTERAMKRLKEIFRKASGMQK